MDSAAITAALQSAQLPVTKHLYTPEHSVAFVPQVLPEVFGDGRALFAFSTINTRPAYWIIRGDSGWATCFDAPGGGGKDFGNFVDPVLEALEEHFGVAELGEHFERDCDGRAIDPQTGALLAEAEVSYPVVNYGCGCFWSRLDWPALKGVDFDAHPLGARVKVLAAGACK